MSRTLIRETLTPPGNAASRSAKSLDQENRFRSISKWAAVSVCCWSGVKDPLISAAFCLSACSCWLSSLISTWMVLALLFAWVVTRAMRIRLTNERKVIKIANVQGRARLLKGLLAKLSRLFTAQILSGCDKDSRAGFTFEAYRPTQMSATGRSRLQGRENLTRPRPTRGSEKY